MSEKRFPEETKKGWIEYIQDFKSEMYPVFEPYGISLENAFNLYLSNALRNQIDDLVELIKKDYTQGEDWKNED